MGADDGPHPEDGEGPIRKVWVDSFSIQSTAVSNADYARFTTETGYLTFAERQGHSFVFHLFDKTTSELTKRPRHTTWWHKVDGACWHSPYGANSSIVETLNHPVSHIALEDAYAFCSWAKCRLPTEAEWECAARGGLESQPFPWGSELEDNNKHRSNIWQGRFPVENTAVDGYVGTAPVDSYQPNNYGLYNMTGNVWEWTADRHTRLHSPRPVKNPKGPLNGDRFVAKGGSYLCHDSYCSRYRTSSRQALTPDTTAGNVGFRVVDTKANDR